MRKQSSQSSHSSATRVNASPSSGAGEHLVRQHVKPRGHAKVVLPRNHSSARNLVKMSRQTQVPHVSTAAEEGRKHHRNHSHEHDTEIRLPGSLDESRPPMRRNLTAYQLPRNASHAKLKKNLSHGQLNRLASGKNLVALASAQQRAPTSPRIKGKHKRPKSAEMTPLERNLQDRELEVDHHQSKHLGPSKSRAEDSKKVGFAVGHESDEDDSPEFDDGAQQEDEWTEESASASPYSTRQNTANNSRRTSVVVERPTVKSQPTQNLSQNPINRAQQQDTQAAPQTGDAARTSRQLSDQERQLNLRETGQKEHKVAFSDSREDEAHKSAMVVKADAAHRAAQQLKEELTDRVAPNAGHGNERDPESESDDTGSPSPPSRPTGLNAIDANKAGSTSPNRSEVIAGAHASAARKYSHTQEREQRSMPPSDSRRISSQPSKEHVNPTTRRFPQQAPVPAVVSNVSALDDTHSSRGSPAPSLRSSKSNIVDGAGDRDPDELVSRFVPSTSHPSTLSGANTATNTPKQTSFYGSEHNSDRQTSGSHPTSPGSVVSSSSGTTAPAVGRSRTETRLMQQKALADREDQQKRDLPTLPAWQYDRLNKSLKSSLNVTRLPTKDNPKGGLIFPGPEAFQGRFRVTNTELRVVQKFRDPIGESLARLRLVKGSKVHQRAMSQKKIGATTLPTRSNVSFPPAQKGSSNANLAKSNSPPYISSPLKRAATNGEQGLASIHSGRQRPKSQLDLARAPPQIRGFERIDDRPLNEDIVRDLWDQCLEPNERSTFH